MPHQSLVVEILLVAYSVVRTEVIDLFIPAGIPKVFADKFDSIEGIGEESSIVAEPATRDNSKEGIVCPSMFLTFLRRSLRHAYLLILTSISMPLPLHP